LSNKAENLNPDDVGSFVDDEAFGYPVYNIEQRFGIAKLFEFGEFIDGISRSRSNQRQSNLLSSQPSIRRP
jgi:hypothetical protein